MSLLQTWREARKASKRESLLRDSDYWRSEATRLSMLAYNIPDMMREPMKWGRVQNAANWARHRERQCIAELANPGEPTKESNGSKKKNR